MIDGTGMIDGVTYVRGAAVRWLEDGFPGWVEVQVATVSGDVILVDKAAVVDAQHRLASDTPYPVDVLLSCEILARDRGTDGEEVITIALSHGVADQTGRNVFKVAASQIVTG